ncbi:uncharacterized protein LOC142984212 isoform X2 [Anticarsia gemmatalis]
MACPQEGESFPHHGRTGLNGVSPDYWRKQAKDKRLDDGFTNNDNRNPQGSFNPYKPKEGKEFDDSEYSNYTESAKKREVREKEIKENYDDDFDYAVIPLQKIVPEINKQSRITKFPATIVLLS